MCKGHSIVYVYVCMGKEAWHFPPRKGESVSSMVDGGQSNFSPRFLGFWTFHVAHTAQGEKQGPSVFSQSTSPHLCLPVFEVLGIPEKFENLQTFGQSQKMF